MSILLELIWFYILKKCFLITYFMRAPRLRVSPRHGGARRFIPRFKILLVVTDPPRGRPFGGGGTHRNEMEQQTTH